MECLEYFDSLELQKYVVLCLRKCDIVTAIMTKHANIFC